MKEKPSRLPGSARDRDDFRPYARPFHVAGKLAGLSLHRRDIMWICLTTGFLSVIADKDPAKLIVLARRKRDLLNTFGQDVAVVETPDRHYRWRIFIDRESFKAVLAGQIDAINYTNFKKSVKDKDLHEMYREFSQIHLQYQEKEG